MDLSFPPLSRIRARDQRRAVAVAPDFGMIIAGVSARQAGSATARAQAALGGVTVATPASFNHAVATLLSIAAKP